ncbi:MAG: hypothetical protein EBU90_04430 [Proteobacteria bacterium]|nr:hypothetical protein [Pseudomonadota bacterium]NBP15082.1 hypothetical protein [bacterium]
MVSFINKSVNYSETVLLKSQLAPLLKEYNELVLSKISANKTNPFSSAQYFIVPNNNIKYYLYITHKQRLEPCRESYNILYFFPDDYTVDFVKESTPIKQNYITEFCLEIDRRFDREYIFEGYLYQNESSNNTQTFLITDILYQQTDSSNGSGTGIGTGIATGIGSGSTSGTNCVVDCDYALRYTLVNEILYSKPGLTALNNHINIGIHPVLSHDAENMVSIMENNFVFARQLSSIERIENFTKTRTQKQTIDDSTQLHATNKLITKGVFPDVYTVQDATTLDQQGILYVKGLKDSKSLKALFQKQDNNGITLPCRYNVSFDKWQPVFD